jgi:hypothetical protein
MITKKKHTSSVFRSIILSSLSLIIVFAVDRYISFLSDEKLAQINIIRENLKTKTTARIEAEAKITELDNTIKSIDGDKNCL